MIRFRKPPATLRAELRLALATAASTFDRTGSTAPDDPRDPPPGFNVDVYRQSLGRGRATFDRAREAIRSWRMFPPSWTEIDPVDEPLEPGLVVSVAARVWPVWFLIACRVVYVIDEEDAGGARFGFAYATLPGHPKRGEERFLVKWNRADDSVDYSILAVSRPAVWYVRAGYPFARMFQRRFGRDSKRSMLAALRD